MFPPPPPPPPSPTAKPRNSKKDSQRSPNRRTVSFPPMFSTIVEKVEEEEKQGKEFEMLPPSPLTDCYYALTLKSRATWPAFLGDWAFKNGAQKSHKRRSKLRFTRYLSGFPPLCLGFPQFRLALCVVFFQIYVALTVLLRHSLPHFWWRRAYYSVESVMLYKGMAYICKPAAHEE